jgi:crotonobetainyl-CoA:carnitine CoA-transferase CaiB-like acyl-CoA transferase
MTPIAPGGSGWLSAYRVLDLTDERGLLAGQMLAKLGADVIQVEPPGGSPARAVGPFDAEGRSFYWSAYAAGKRGVTLDIGRQAGRDLLLRLLETADVVIDTAAPGRLAALGLGYEDLRAVQPRIVHVSITPFGADGPKRDYADAELVMWAAGGPLHPNRDADGLPLRISVPQAYLHGAADAAAGALIALLARQRTGAGQHVDISVQQSVTQATLSCIMAAAVGHPDFIRLPQAPKPGGAKSLDLSGSGTRTRRSKWVARDGLVEMHLGLGPATGGKTNAFFGWVEEEGELPDRFREWDWITVPDRLLKGELQEEDIEAARTVVANFFASRTKAEIMAVALRRKLLLAPVNDVADLLASPQLKARGFFSEVEEGGVTRTLPGPFAYGPEGMFAPARGAPTLGQHNEAVFESLLGLSSGELAELRAKGVV